MVRQHEAHRPDDVRRRAQQQFAFPQRMANQLEIIILQVAQAAVDKLGAGGGGVLSQIILLAQKHAQTASGCISGDTRAIDPASYDQ